jgi:transposase
MKYIEGILREQLILYPDKLDDLVALDNPARVIDAFVDQLDLGKLGFKNATPPPTGAGRPCYPPESLLKLYIYGYFKKIRSSRKLMEACETNIEAMWLTGRLTPDFRTISDFRKNNADKLKKVFKAFIMICVELGLYSREIGVQDGSKFRAVNSKDNNVTINKLQKRLGHLGKKIDEYLEEMGRLDGEESAPQKYSKEEMAAKLEQLRAQKEKCDRLLREMEEEGATQKSFTDEDARLMKTANGGFDVCYNAQILVDPSSHMIGHYEATNQCNDMGLLSPVTAQAKEDLGADTMEVAADKGYEDRADLLECLLNGTVPHVPTASGEKSYEFELDYKEADVTGEMRSSTKPEDIKACLEAGVVPDAYEGKGIEATLEEIECGTGGDGPRFELSEDGTEVTCPNGSLLGKVARLHNKDKTRFTNRSACAKCEDKCTASKFKQVDLKDGQTVLYARGRQKKKIVRVRFTPDKDMILMRKRVVEHPFGTVKRWNDGSYLLLKGLGKVDGEFALSFLAYNMKRAINMVGVVELIERMKGMGGLNLGRFFQFFHGTSQNHPFIIRDDFFRHYFAS